MARQALKQTESQGSTLQQQRGYMGGPQYSPKQFSRESPVDRSSTVIPKNPYIEAWAWRRDNLEREFSWNGRHTFEAAYFIVGFSTAVYFMSAWAVRHSDRRSGLPRREMLFSDRGTTFFLPDEREFY